MSVVSKNPFDLLGDDGDESPAPAPTPKPKAEPPKPVPGSAPSDAPRRGRGGGYPGRGAPRNVYREEPPRNTGPTSAEGVAEGMETPGGFDGERVPNSRKGNHVRDAHTKGPRGSRPARNFTSGGHSSAGAGNVRGPKNVAQGGERRQFERRSGGLPDSQKKIDQGWGAEEGTAELTAEVEGLKDAVAEEHAPDTPVEGDGGWGAPDAPPEAAPEPASEAPPAEPEEVQKSLDDYLAERAAASFALGKKEGRLVNSESVEGKAFVRETIDEFFSGKEKGGAAKAKVPKKEKVFIEFDGQFASPAGRPTRGVERGRGRGLGRGDARGARGGGGRGRGAPRGRGGFSGGGAGASGNIDANDQSLFPALGA